MERGGFLNWTNKVGFKETTQVARHSWPTLLSAQPRSGGSSGGGGGGGAPGPFSLTDMLIQLQSA